MTYKKQDKSRIVQIWGNILDEGFTSVPNLLLRYRSILGIKPQHLCLIVDIMSFKWDTESPFPSYTTLANRAGVDERTIKRITQDLEELGLLIKEPRFDEVTGAQITTVFDFRPMVRKLMDERIKILGGDKNVTGEGDKNVTGEVTKMSRGRVTKMSPKEYTYINNTNIKKSTYNNDNNSNHYHINKSDITTNNKHRNKGHTDIKSGIYRKRLYEIYDNLIGIKPLEELVEEGIQKALRDVISNRITETSNILNYTDIDAVTNKIKQHFPYTNIPSDIKLCRRFYVDTITNLIVEELTQ